MMLRLKLALFLPILLAVPLAGQVVRSIRPVRSQIDLKVGQVDSVRFQYFDRNKRELDPGKIKPRYESLDSTVVGINPGTGSVIGRAEGTAQIRVTAGSRFGYVQVSVASAPPVIPAPPPAGHLELQTTQLRLITGESGAIAPHVIGSEGIRPPDSQLSFRAINRDVATVDALTGRVTAMNPGSTEVEVLAPGFEPRIVSVVVSSDELALSTDSLFLLMDTPDTLRVLVPSQGNRSYKGAVTWQSSNPNVVRMDGDDGVLVPVTAGEAEIKVNTAGFEKAVWVRVYEKGTARSFPPTSDTLLQLPLGSRTPFSVRAIATDGSGAVLYNVPAIWKVSDTSIVAFDPATGVLSALREGQASLTARPRLKAMQRPRTWQIKVIGGRLVPEIPLLGLRLGMKASVSALFVDSAGHRTGQLVPVTWGDLDSPVARVTSSSQLEAVGVGRAQVTGRVSWGDTVHVTVLGLSDLLISMAVRGGGTGIYGLQLWGNREPAEVVQMRGTENHHASISPDRSRMVFVSNRGGKESQLWLADADGANPEPLTTGPGRNDQPVWSRDGKWILYTSFQGGRSRIFAVRPDNSGLHALTDTNVTAQAPSFSPDGALLVFETFRRDQYDVVGIRVDSAMARLPRPEEGLLIWLDDERTPQFFPNGDLAFIQQERLGKRLRRLNRRISASSIIPLTPPELYVIDYAISPDGQSVVVAASASGKPSSSNPVQLYLIDPKLGATGTPTPLISAPGVAVGAPVFVP